MKLIIIMFAEKKGDGFRMTEVEGEISAEGEKNKSKSKANDQAEDAKLENFSEGKQLCTLLAKLMSLYDHCKQIHIISDQSLQVKHQLTKHTQ